MSEYYIHHIRIDSDSMTIDFQSNANVDCINFVEDYVSKYICSRLNFTMIRWMEKIHDEETTKDIVKGS